MFHKIVVGLDLSAIGKQVFETSVALAKETEAKLILLHVLSSQKEGSFKSSVVSSWEYYPGLGDQILEVQHKQWYRLEQQGVELLRSHLEAATVAGVKAEIKQISGHPGRTICDFAQSCDADLIVVGRRGHSGLSELVLGSVSNYVLHHAPCSVLTVQSSNYKVT